MARERRRRGVGVAWRARFLADPLIAIWKIASVHDSASVPSRAEARENSGRREVPPEFYLRE
jgi:hypothetical protein